MSPAQRLTYEQSLTLAQFVRAQGFVLAALPEMVNFDDLAFDTLDWRVLVRRTMQRKANDLAAFLLEAQFSFYLGDAGGWGWSTPLSGMAARHQRAVNEFMSHVDGRFRTLRSHLEFDVSGIVEQCGGPLMPDLSAGMRAAYLPLVDPSALPDGTFGDCVTLARPNSHAVDRLDFCQFLRRVDSPSVRQTGVRLEREWRQDCDLYSFGSALAGKTQGQVFDEAVADFRRRGWALMSDFKGGAPVRAPIAIDWARAAAVGADALFQ